VYEDQNRQKDAAVIGAFVEGYNNDGIFAPTSVEVANTIKAFNDLFCVTF